MTSHQRPELIHFGTLEIFLPDDHPDTAARSLLAGGATADDAARQLPASSLAWALLAEHELSAEVNNPVAAYAYARTGYHRGLDSLRRAGWKGIGLIPADHVPNQGFLRALLALAQAADAIGEADEANRCQEFLGNSGTDEAEVAALR